MSRYTQTQLHEKNILENPNIVAKVFLKSFSTSCSGGLVRARADGHLHMKNKQSGYSSEWIFTFETYNIVTETCAVIHSARAASIRCTESNILGLSMFFAQPTTISPVTPSLNSTETFSADRILDMAEINKQITVVGFKMTRFFYRLRSQQKCVRHNGAHSAVEPFSVLLGAKRLRRCHTSMICDF